MRLYLLRHGHAEDGMGISDHDRQLTPEGITRLHTAARMMAALELNPLKIYSSPRLRARQTAQIVAQALNKAVDISEEVNFSFSVSAVQTLLKDVPANREVMFVGHNPSMSAVVNALTGADVMMKKGGLACIDLIEHTPMRGELVWLITPRVFDAFSG